MLPEAHITHIIRGRLRVKIPVKKGDASYFADLSGKMTGCEGVERIEVNSVTSSVLIIHSTDSKNIAEYAEENSLFRIQEVKFYEKQTYISRKITETFNGLNRKVTVSTKGFANLPDIAVLTLIGLSAFQISRGNFIAPAWYAALWYALNIFLKSQPSEAEGN
jgi:hypothetical protein